MSGNEYYKVVNKAIYSKDETTLVTVIGNPTSFTIPNGVTQIGDQAFHNKGYMQEVIIPNTVKSIGVSFNFCSSLTKIEIPSSVESIKSGCFSSSPNLKEIRIHKKKGEIEGAPWGAIITDRAIIWDAQ